jgi:hypothetical protein
MKFVGSSHNGSDAPLWVQQLVLAGWAEIEIEEIDNSGWSPGERPRPTIERYEVRTWTTADQRRFKFLAIAGKDRDYIESLASPMFSGRGRARS